MFIRLATGWSGGRLVRNIKMQQIFRYVIIPERNGTARRVAQNSKILFIFDALGIEQTTF